MCVLETITDALKGHECIVTPLAIFGALVVSASVLNIASAAYKSFLRPGKNLTKYGKWAIVTGATDGIGKAYAMALAKKGMSIILISRTEAKLQAVKEEIEAKGYSGVEVKYIVCDYSKFNDAAKASVKNAIAGLEIGVLINNVGVSYRYPMFFNELSDDEIAGLIEMNVNSTVWMTRFVLKDMAERKRGAIVNISSGSAMYTLPLLAEYSAAKSFIEKFTLALNAEYGSKGISVQCQIPFYVSTKLAKMRKSLTVPTPEDFAKRALRFVGQPEPVVSPYWIHGVMGWVLDHLPNFVVTKIIMNMHLSTRKRGLKKDKAKAEEAAKKGE
jgi:17beta-estradiol 17-dehydrogenase / very-long-chain 3-oxoacyl-CoA reductase